MDNTSEEEIKNLKNQYEIEETVASILKFEGDILYFTEKLRRTKPRQFATEDRRLKSNKKRLSHWNQLATSFAIKCFGENNIKATTIMAGTEQGNNSSTVNNSNILKIAEILKEVILAKTRRTILILLRSPRSLMGLGIPMSLTLGYSQLKIISGLSSDMIMNNFANLVLHC